MTSNRESQTSLLAAACALALGVVGAVFFIYMIMKVPVWGAVKVSVVVLGWFQAAFFAVGGLLWLLFNYSKPRPT